MSGTKSSVNPKGGRKVVTARTQHELKAPLTPATNVAGESTEATPHEQQARSEYAMELGKLNRHWYRRCLDSLGKDLSQRSRMPSINELRQLCDSILTGYLSYITGQAPDAKQQQFPADRAYYIPFEGDNAGAFNFAKSYYLFPPESNEGEDLNHSIWSFFPLDRRRKNVEISPELSVDGDGKTISFEEMISLQAKSRHAETAGSSDRLVLRKSLLLRGNTENKDHSDLLEQMLPSASKTGTQTSESPWRAELDKSIGLALVEIFRIYKETPGNASVELLLLNHFHVVQWLFRLHDGAGDTVSQRDEEYVGVFRRFLRAYFCEDYSQQPPRAVNESGTSETLDLINHLMRWVDESAAATRPEMPRQASVLKPREIAQLLLKQEGTLFLEALAAAKKPREGTTTRFNAPSEDLVEAELNELLLHLRAFRQFFLNSKSEKRLESALTAALGDDPLRAGETKHSFVWVCRDFAKMDLSLPEVHCGMSPEEKAKLKALWSRLDIVMKPYKDFYQRLETISLRQPKRAAAITSYWFTLGRAKEREKTKVYASFSDGDAGLAVPPLTMVEAVNPRMQNVFVRVRICDSLNEPMIDGLFVFTSDHDEEHYKGKNENDRWEDIQDLLAFSKVYFFLVRDYFHGLDRAREASDIGRLNQHLYDRRLADLNKCMKKRLSAPAFRNAGISDRDNADQFVYEVINNYAYSLCEQPPEVRREAFPYDRLFVIPLTCTASKDAEDQQQFQLPFYLFQSIFVERRDGKIVDDHYSLLKPFQSPIEGLTKEGSKRFSVRSFQQNSWSDGKVEPLSAYLEKRYVGEAELTGELWSSVVKAITSDFESREIVPAVAATEQTAKSMAQAGARPDTGYVWASWALQCLWEQTTRDAAGLEIWREFLVGITHSYRELLNQRLAANKLSTDDFRARQSWFLFRFGVLRLVLQHVEQYRPQSPESLQKIMATYEDDLKLLFDNQTELNVVKLASGGDDYDTARERRDSRDPFTVLKRENSEVSLNDDPEAGLEFASFDFRGDDRFMLRFFQHLTEHVTNKKDRVNESWNGRAVSTWFQPMLTRPLEVAASQPCNVPVRDATVTTQQHELHRRAGERIGDRIPPYAALGKGRDALSMFLCVVKIEMGQSDQDKRAMRYLIGLVRDYDDRQVGRIQSEEMIQEQLAIDKADLGLYTTTFFSDAQKFVSDAIARQQLRLLSTDITQIGRNWYSRGIDRIVNRLQRKLKELVERSEPQGLGRLRAETMDCLFDELVSVLLGPEIGRDGNPIKLESFPFDRALHIPLYSTPTDSARLRYVRTAIEWNKDQTTGAYKELRKSGRAWDAVGGKKILFGQTTSVGRNPDAGLFQYLDEQECLQPTDLFRSLSCLADLPTADNLVRCLYEANPRQSLAVAGLIRHLLLGAKSLGLRGWDSKLDDVCARLGNVLSDTIRSLEREVRDAPVQTKVYMARAVSFADAMDCLNDPANPLAATRRLFGTAEILPVFRELFKSLNGPEDYEYGLQAGVKSKIFFVYYSVQAPEAFTDELEQDSRYRGVFCFLVDDTTTDDKSPKVEVGSQQAEPGGLVTGLSDAEITDQEDIHTLVHNTMNSLRLVLEQQALQNQLNQPGIEEFILGMLHRLKNELGIPRIALGEFAKLLENVSSVQNDLAVSKDDVVAADQTILGIENLFKSLKGLTEIQQGVVALQTYSSNWLAWLFVVKLCAAAKSLLRRQVESTAGQTPLDSILAEIDEYRKEAKEALDASEEATNVVDRVQRLLFRLEAQLGLAVRDKTHEKAVHFFFGFQLLEAAPLEFRGSHLLEEAINILVENAVQALWSYVQSELETAAANSAPIEGRLQMVVCRRQGCPDEVLIEIRNSSKPIHEDNLKILKAPVPRPMTSQQHSAVSGKSGGSGFGHYYARRVISTFCGGREFRRKLDVDISHDPQRAEAIIRVNLLEAKPAESQVIFVADLVPPSESAFGPDLVRKLQDALIDKPKKLRFRFLGDIRLIDVFHVARRILDADRQAEMDRLMGWTRDRLCAAIRDSTVRFRDSVVAMVEQAALDDSARNMRGPLAAFAADLRNNRTCRKGSFDDLIRVLHRWAQDHATVMQQLISSASSGDSALLCLNNGSLKALNLIPEQKQSELEKDFERRGFWCLLQNQPGDNGPRYSNLVQKLGVTENGGPVPDQSVVSDLMRPARLDYRIEASESRIHLALRLYDGEYGQREIALNAQSGKDSLDAKSIRTRFSAKQLGRIFLQYQEAFRTKLPGASTAVGDLWFEKHQPDPNQPDDLSHRTVHLVLNLSGESDNPQVSKTSS